jgi:hypothetical protein
MCYTMRCMKSKGSRQRHPGDHPGIGQKEKELSE